VHGTITLSFHFTTNGAYSWSTIYDIQARGSLYANTQLRAHRRAENKNKEQKKRKNKE
jgi:hypothetical protein